MFILLWIKFSKYPILKSLLAPLSEGIGSYKLTSQELPLYPGGHWQTSTAVAMLLSVG